MNNPTTPFELRRTKRILALFLLFTINTMTPPLKSAVMVPVFTWTIGGGVKLVTARVLFSAFLSFVIGYIASQNGADTSAFYHKFDDNDNNKWEINEQNCRDPKNNKHNHYFNDPDHGPMGDPNKVMDLAKETVEKAWKNGYRPDPNGEWSLSTPTSLGRLIMRGVVIDRTIYYGTIFLEGYMKK